MPNLRQQTVDSYNNSAKEFAEYFAGIGPRVKYIERALKLSGNPGSARILEIGCGDGRDAVEIVKRAGWYKGFDISSGLIAIAKQKLPETDFEVGDALSFSYPQGLDIVFAFASVLHLDKSELSVVMDKVFEALKPGGIFYISTKYRPKYESEIKNDNYGTRLFYFYNTETLRELAGDNYKVVFEEKETIGHTEWLEIALQKQ